MLLKSKTAVVTGCNRGIGKRILKTFSENGATVFACARKIDDEFRSFNNELVKKFNNEIIPIQFDLNDENTIKEAATNIIKSNKSSYSIHSSDIPMNLIRWEVTSCLNVK